MTIAYDVGAPTTASGTGLTFAIPTGYSGASSSSGYYQYARIFSNGSAVSTGMAHVNATNIECFLNGAGGAIASTSTKSAQGIITFDID